MAMHSEPYICDHDALRRSLRDELNELDEERLAQHLDHCPRCRQALDDLAAEGATWSRIQAALQAEHAARTVHPQREQHTSLQDTASYSPLGEPPYAHLPFDFAVDFLAPATDDDCLGRLGDIDILGVIGQGGMGIVLKGFQPALNRPVAVKVLAPHLATSGAARQRFAREAQAAAVIMHPNVMPIFSVDASGKLPFLVMPFIECESLQQRLDRQGALEVEDILRIGMQVANGLAAAHAQGLVHRDVKPANILLEKGVQRVMLTDFGLARAADDASLTRTGVIAGTPQYMSPEQARGDTINASSDLFSLGSVLYAASTGRPPFRADTSYGILRRITDTHPRPIQQLNPRIPTWLTQIVDQLLQKHPEHRYGSADEVAKLFEQCLAHVQSPQAAPLPRFHRFRNWTLPRPRNDYLVSCFLLLASSLVVAAGAYSLGMLPWNSASSGEAAPPTGASAAVPATPLGPDRSTVPQKLMHRQTTQATAPQAASDVLAEPTRSVLQEDVAEVEARLQQLQRELDALRSEADSFWEF